MNPSLNLGSRRCALLSVTHKSTSFSKARTPSASASATASARAPAPSHPVIQVSTTGPSITPTVLLQHRRISSTAHFKMPTYIVSCKEDASDDQVKAAKQHAIDQGGEIKHEYSIIKGFSVAFPEGTVTTLDSHEAVKLVEADGVATTQ